jgi:(E)-4-hydroxy-3-methylbut-2-enyl-diphosphate synthase
MNSETGNNYHFPQMINYKRLTTREVHVGGVGIGGNNAIRVQSMLNTKTDDVQACVDQIMNLSNTGSELVRLTVPSLKDVEHLKTIIKQIRTEGLDIPVVADTHFNPKIAISCAQVVEKVRINPGNFSDRSTSSDSDQETLFSEGYQKFREKLSEYISVCKQYNTATRLGTNHGSLSKRMLDKYGDTPQGMAESVMEAVRICLEYDYHDIVISLKASNTRLMVYANRLLVSMMKEEGIVFPLHLGVTEAGEGENGRIKSAVGIGTLLHEGIGDTIRVSLTEDPMNEIPVAKKITEHIKQIQNQPFIEEYPIPVNLFEYSKKQTTNVSICGGDNHPVIVHDLRNRKIIDEELLTSLGFLRNKETNSWIKTEKSADFIIISEKTTIQTNIPESLVLIGSKKAVKKLNNSVPYSLLLTPEEFSDFSEVQDIVFMECSYHDLTPERISKLKSKKNIIICLKTSHQNGTGEQRAAIFKLVYYGCKAPVIICREYNEKAIEDIQILSSMDIGPLFIDGLAEGICIKNDISVSVKKLHQLQLGILQASRARISETEYISCPGCGRTSFDLLETTKKIKEQTSHLTGLKIAVMGCIVNGPGEMADADYGYIGSGTGKISLFKSKQCIKRNMKEKEAVEKLIELIKLYGDWKKP